MWAHQGCREKFFLSATIGETKQDFSHISGYFTSIKQLFSLSQIFCVTSQYHFDILYAVQMKHFLDYIEKTFNT